MSSERKATLQNTPCPICGGRSFTWGLSVGESPTQRLYARPDGAGWGEGRELRTRECHDCGNVQFFTRVDEYPLPSDLNG
ncbi:MAG: hypothetical protein J0L63_20085 [Anaerolineae bacterium]|nr:hypothetical protein [Anaerolineae bacterium]MBN8621223.1 hypothetical protein [Anaerolineae bacterium]